MLNNLFRKYNQNKRGLWTIIIVIVFSYIVLQAIYGLLRNNKEKRKEIAVPRQCHFSLFRYYR